MFFYFQQVLSFTVTKSPSFFILKFEVEFKTYFFVSVSVVFLLFRFNRNTETRCFDIEPKQPKQASSFG
jgi:hypothetical protein